MAMERIGYLIDVYASTIADRSSQDSTKVENANYEADFLKTAGENVGVFKFAQSNGYANTGSVSGDIPYFSTSWEFELDVSNGCWSGDLCDLDLEWYNAEGATVYAMRVRTDRSYSSLASWGSSLSSLTSGGKWGTYGRGHGVLSFTDTQVIYTQHGTSNAWKSYTGNADMASVVGMRVVYARAYEKYTSASGCSAMVRFDLSSPDPAIWLFTGNFLTYFEVPDVIAYPTDAIVSTTVGTGLLNSNGTAIYLEAPVGISEGETKHFIDINGLVFVILEYTGSVITATIDGEESVIYDAISTYDTQWLYGELCLADSNGDLFWSSGNVISESTMFPTFELLDGEVRDTLALVDVKFDKVMFTSYPTIKYPKPIAVVKNNPFSQNLFFDNKGLPRRFGYIENTVSLDGEVITNKEVKCFEYFTGKFISSTFSDSHGKYRFDYLMMGSKYMTIAHYGSENPNTAPDYNATTSGWLLPTAYEKDLLL